jgi:signal transduction histidine kinase
LSHSNVLIISDDTEFARSIVARWQSERRLPEITVTTGDLWRAQSAANYNLVIVGPLQISSPSAILSSLSACPATATIYVSNEGRTDSFLVAENPHVLFLSREDGWVTTLILIATEALRRSEAITRAQRAERLGIESNRHASLGRYMLEMRPSVNNALTSVLGNADLLLLEPEKISTECHDQIRTIQTMALRLNEIMQRFSSLAAEMRGNEKESQAETASGLRVVGIKT